MSSIENLLVDAARKRVAAIGTEVVSTPNAANEEHLCGAPSGVFRHDLREKVSSQQVAERQPF